MASKEEVQRFLDLFHQKMEVFNIVYRDDRGKNLSTLAALDIPPIARTRIIRQIVLEDYSEGPIADTLNRIGEMWVFGKDVTGKEVYIKISMGHPNSSTICISFHLAEHPMQYPYKAKGTKKKGGKK